MSSLPSLILFEPNLPETQAIVFNTILLNLDELGFPSVSNFSLDLVGQILDEFVAMLFDTQYILVLNYYLFKTRIKFFESSDKVWMQWGLKLKPI